MAPIDRRLRVWAWMVRRQTAALTQSEAAVIALQSRSIPDNPVTNYIFGTVAPATEASDRVIPGPGGDLPVRVSIGVAQLSEELMGSGSLVSAADAAMYEAKRQGRDRVVAASSATGAGRS